MTQRGNAHDNGAYLYGPKFDSLHIQLLLCHNGKAFRVKNCNVLHCMCIVIHHSNLSAPDFEYYLTSQSKLQKTKTTCPL